jgi:hypothetical protein
MPGIHRKRAASYFTADMGAGVGAVVFVNAAANPGPIVQYARRLLCAAVTDGSVPDAPAAADRVEGRAVDARVTWSGRVSRPAQRLCPFSPCY